MKYLLRSAMCVIPLIFVCVSCARNTGSEGGGMLPDLGMNSAVDEPYVPDGGKRIRFTYPKKSHVAAKVVQWGAPIYNAIIDIRLTRNGQPVPLAHIEFSRSISGRTLVYASEGGTLHDGTAQVAIVRDGYASASGYYVARATDANTHELLGTWGSIPINEGRITELELPIGEQVQAASRVLTDRITEPSFKLVPHNAGDRVAVPGATGVLVASFDVVFAHDVLQYPLRHIVIQDDFDGPYALGDMFSNMRIEMEGKQLGYTFGTLHTGETVSDEYGMGYVYDGLAIVGQKGDIRTVNVYADVRASVPLEAMDAVFADDDGVVEPYMISGRGNHQFDVYPDGPMLRVGIMQRGSANIEIEVESFEPATIHRSGGKVLSFFVESGIAEDVEFNSLAFPIVVRNSAGALLEQPIGIKEVVMRIGADVVVRSVPEARVRYLHREDISGIVQFNLRNWAQASRKGIGEVQGTLEVIFAEDVPADTRVQMGVAYNLNNDGDNMHPAGIFRGVTSSWLIRPSVFWHSHDWFVLGQEFIVAAQ